MKTWLRWAPGLEPAGQHRRHPGAQGLGGRQRGAGGARADSEEETATGEVTGTGQGAGVQGQPQQCIAQLQTDVRSVKPIFWPRGGWRLRTLSGPAFAEPMRGLAGRLINYVEGGGGMASSRGRDLKARGGQAG